ncbi:potassium/sodium efflux P-type ATPase, fungal-type [Verruconis gallopava]|uniref:Potassium/sodium efflux P-type ATPase, fungal-type n=1 Tax=Verruconis gallopava TaxID=253628 RepID=A0A0D1YPT3_9PEZI|nr:potassium/sodium efflux P-type ATPase, fungal-type [Verruconis gallopava]KIW02627.1 potassium/sodium efflux P-type ATPase, fungal-type [Verruconis gallopava]
MITMAISYGIKDYVEGSVIAAVISLNVVVGFVQDLRAEQQIQALKAMSAPLAKVIRNGVASTIKSESLVVGDLIQIGVGDRIPADARVVESVNLASDESALTGEALPRSKRAELVLSNLPNGNCLELGDRKNMVYSGTIIASGRGKAIVVATGSRSEFGKTSGLLDPRKEEKEKLAQMGILRRLWFTIFNNMKTILGLDAQSTPLVRSLSKFALLLFTLAILLTIIVFAVNKFDVHEEVLIYGICVAVAIIPESLIAVLTITQAVGAKAMARGNVLVRKITALEAVGGTTHICSDKTGTLTGGKMIATQAWIPQQHQVGRLSVVDVGNPFNPDSGSVHRENLELPTLGSRNPVTKFLRTVALCNLAVVTRGKTSATLGSDVESVDTSNGEWTGDGEPGEVALQVLAMRFGLAKDTIIAYEELTFTAEYPFSSKDKRMTVVYRDRSGTHHAFTKGATEVLLEKSTADDSLKLLVRTQLEQYASQGLRIMTVAYRAFGPDSTQRFEQENREEMEQELEFLGLVGIQDPPRPETAGAVRRAQIAGIKVHMLTGDHQKTAESIAKAVGIIPTGLSDAAYEKLVMPASKFDRMSNEELDALEHLPLVVARCSPETKVRMVQAMNRRKAFCVMTGDGVNDAPALKRSDVGFAMGRNGTDVAKEASDMVLTDDNFASIVKAVEEGRRLFDNIQKFLMHLLISNISQVFLLLIGLAFRDKEHNSVFPLAPLEILWVNLITSSFLAIGLGLERAQHDIMLRPPHDLKIGVFTRELIIDKMMYGTFMGSLCLAAFASVAYGAGAGDLGEDCNNGWNESCGIVFRARATTYATLTYLLLVTAWEVKHFKRSLFNIDPVRFEGPFSIFPALWSNQFLFWAVVAGFVLVFPIIYIPRLNTEVFKHTSITWEWGVVFACLLTYITLVESWKAIKRAKGWGTPLSKEAKIARAREAKSEMGMDTSTGGTSTPI